MSKPKQYEYGVPKWPALIVHGDPVNKRQAAEIIVRTAGELFWNYTNDREWQATINGLTGCCEPGHDIPDGERRAAWVRYGEWEESFEEEIGALRLEYLNNHQVASAWVGGPHGWCSWGGEIGCRSYNIGKWPSVKEVHLEWGGIASAFPFLSLRSQLWDRESTEEGGRPVVEFAVQGGEARVMDPESSLGETAEFGVEAVVASLVGGVHRERGCTEEMLREALDIARHEATARRQVIQ